ncbi:MAG: diguanylate cyclase [Firmicutes bacterium]|nr:diguanylate cyclase [Bacillota bacterium]
MRKPRIFKRFNNSMINSVMISMIMLIILSMILLYTAGTKKQKDVLDVTHRYVAFENRVQSFIMNNSTLLNGFTAYIETFDSYSDDDIYRYLNNLLVGRMYYISNVGIVKDTTILWNYPFDNNKKAIGVDLTTIPNQISSINKVRETLQSNFDGPVDLVQGGKGYIIRSPIVKEGKYWGVASIVLDSEKLVELFDSYAKENNIKVAIFNKNNGGSLVYGDENIKNQTPLIFHSNFIYNDWTFCVLPEDNSLNSNLSVILLITITGLIIGSFITYRSYNIFKSHEEIRRKNIILKKTSVRDKLTQIYNRSYLDAILVEEIHLADKNESSLSIIYFDLDFFKYINDTHGHTLGDTVLKGITVLVKESLRNSDVFARWGGDEFAIIMPFTSLKGALVVAEKIRMSISEYHHPIVKEITASFGVTEYMKGENPDNLFDRVDKALYLAKENGRNKVCTYNLDGSLKCY